MQLLSILFVSMALTSASPDGFREKYAELDSLPNTNRLVYDGAVTPQWTGSGEFVYQTRRADGMHYFVVSASDKSKTEITSGEYEEYLSKIPARERRGWDMPDSVTSPDGRHIAFLRDNNVWVKDVDGSEASYTPSGAPVRGNERQLSFDGTDQNYYAGLYWSPDSKKVASIQREYVKERQIPLRESAPEDQIQPELRWLDYAKPGDRLPQAAPALFDVASGTQMKVDMAPFSNQYFLNFGQWSQDSDYFTFEYNQRGHQLYQLVAVSSEDASTRILAEEKTSTFVYYYDLYRYYMDCGDILWISERDDWRHLYRINGTTGGMTLLTPGEWNVREIYDVNEEDGYVLFAANGMNAIDEKGGTPAGEDPYNKHLLKLDLGSLEITDLTPEAANHIVTFNSDHTLFSDVYSRPDMAPVSLLRDIEGNTLMELQKADISALLATGWTMPEVFVAKGRDGETDIWGTIFRPSNFNPKKKYPVVEYIYAGPHDSFVLKDFYAYLRFSKLVEMGFIVVTIDGMGTDNRSKSFQDVCWRNLKDSGYPDRILWMQAAAKKYRHMDISNVGVYGYSAGGQSTLAALLFYPEFYKVGVALCGCHDNRMDKIWWNEQWMGYPIGPWYSENSNVDNAWRLQGKLLLINGEMDDNVDPASTLQVVKALIKADKDFEQFYLPGYTHNLGDDYVTRKVFEFFYENIIEK